MRTCRRAATAAEHRDGVARFHHIAFATHDGGVVFVDRQNVAMMLNANDITTFIAPVGKDDGAVGGGFYDCVGLSYHIDTVMLFISVEMVGHQTVDRHEKQLVDETYRIRRRNRWHPDAVEFHVFVADDALEVLDILVFLTKHLLDGVGAVFHVVDAAVEGGVGVARDELTQRGEEYQTCRYRYEYQRVDDNPSGDGHLTRVKTAFFLIRVGVYDDDFKFAFKVFKPITLHLLSNHSKLNFPGVLPCIPR